jgi:uncharacterized small protein (DUF1192 family)
MKHPIPTAALKQHIAFLGKTGSGKTSTAKLAVEQILRDDPTARVCVLDPIKSDWWGLTSSANGRNAGLPFYILGGPRGHVQLHDSAGKAIGELVANGALPLSIIDMADFKPGGLQRFFNDFAPALMKRMRGVVYLVLEEAHEFAPKERTGIGAESIAIHYARQLATAGRSKGIRIIVVTQRTQALHNALLGSCDTMIAHRLTAPADQEPVKKWLKANVSKEIFDKVSTSLASLKTGSAWICSGEAQVAELVQFPKISTFDNSATPTGDEASQEIKTAPVDQDKLRAIIGTAVKEAEADDPKALRAEITRLKADLAKKPAGAPVADAAAIAAAEQRGFLRGFEDAKKQGTMAFEGLKAMLRSTMQSFATSFDGNVRGEAIEFEIQQSGSPTDRTVPSPTRRPEASPAARSPSPAARGDGNLSGPEQRIINSLATWASWGQHQPSNSQVAWLAGYSPSSSSYANPRGALNSKGLIKYPAPDFLQLTADGAAAGAPMAMSGSLVDLVLSKLTGPEARILRAVTQVYPNSATNEEAAVVAGYSPTSSSYANPRGALKSKELISYPSQGCVRAADWLFAA